MGIRNPLDRAIFRSTVNKSPKNLACTQMGHLGQVRPHRISCPSSMSYHFMSILREKNEKRVLGFVRAELGLKF